MSEPVPEPAPPADWRERLELLAGGSTVSPGQVAVAAVAVAAAAVLAWLVLRQPDGPLAEASMTPVGGAAATTSTTSPPVVFAHAAGAVRAPGLYRLDPGARVADLLAAAGGPSPDADLDRVNLAAPVVDGAQVYLPRVGEAVPASASAGAAGSAAPSRPLDLNTATLDQFEELPGVGPATAQAIVAEREDRGGFASVEELLDVRGIGPAKLDAIRDLVTV